MKKLLLMILLIVLLIIGCSNNEENEVQAAKINTENTYKPYQIVIGDVI